MSRLFPPTPGLESDSSSPAIADSRASESSSTSGEATGTTSNGGPSAARRLRILVGESDKHEGLPVHEWLTQKAKEHDLMGTVVLRADGGYGVSTMVHPTHFLHLSAEQPILIEIVDSPEKIEAFVPLVEESISEGMVTVEPVEVIFQRTRS